MSFKKNMQKLDYIYLDLRYKLDEISNLENKGKEKGVTPELTAKISKKKVQTVSLMKLAALKLGINIDNLEKIKNISDFNAFPKFYDWMYLTNAQNNETSAALFLREGLKTEMNRQELSAKDYLVFKRHGLEFTWDSIKKLITGKADSEEEKDFLQLLRMSDPEFDALIHRLSRRNDYIESANNSSERYLNQIIEISDLKDITPELIRWVEYRTTLPETYINSIKGKSIKK